MEEHAREAFRAEIAGRIRGRSEMYARCAAVAAHLNEMGDYGATVEYDGWIRVPYTRDEFTGERRYIAFGTDYTGAVWTGHVQTESGIYQGGFDTGNASGADQIAAKAHEIITRGQIEWE